MKNKKRFYKRFKNILKDIILPIIMGVSSLVVAVSANKIYKKQALIAKNAEAPTIYIQEKHQSTDYSRDNMETIIEISLLDGKFDNYQCETVTFLKCDFCDDKDMAYTVLDTYEVPISSYYNIREYPVQKYGLIEELHSGEFYGNYEEIRKSIEELYYERNNLILDTSIETYLKISYLNLLGKSEEYYYNVGSATSVSEGVKIDKKLGEKIFAKYNKMIKKEEFIFIIQGEELPIENIYDIVVNNNKFRM